ncbi:MAG: MBL fold metallo-hydrolase [Candidatus Lokiarchaeota archaeon]|nr:MBL fold metallo-hydrolase [Candidatus Lokiarchaeota archaeon]
MKISTEVPKTTNKILSDFFESGLEDAKETIKGKSISAKKDLFDENPELIVWAMIKASGIEPENLEHAKQVAKTMDGILRDTHLKIKTDEYLEAMTLLLYKFILGIHNDEEFRYAYRYSLYNIRDQKPINTWLKKAIVVIVLANDYHKDALLEQIREWIRFLGSPLWKHRDFVQIIEEFGESIESVIETDGMRFVDSVVRHPQYLKEALQHRTLSEVIKESHDWLPDGMMVQSFKILKATAYENAQERIESTMSVDSAFDILKEFFQTTGFTNGKYQLPIRVHELPSPPPPEAIDPVIFELIPEKMRKKLLPSVAYSKTTKTVEIIFLGGPRIGRSGILIKTDTGGILLDFGMSVANQRIPEWIPELEMIDTVLVSHSHLDHLGGLPILYDSFDGKWCSVGITGGIGKFLLEDAMHVGTPLPPRKYDKHDLISKFTQKNIESVFKNHVILEYGKTQEIGPGILTTPIDACHIPGSAAYIIDIEGVKILYTGDFNIDKSVLFEGANLPTDCDAVIFDGTYWGREDFSRDIVTNQILNITGSYGPIVIPSFAVGRTQEMLMLLENTGITESKNVMVAGLAEKITKLTGYTGKWESMKKNKVYLEQDDILVAGGGMMSGGLARHHFNEHRNNPNAAIIMCGYLATRTPGWNLINGYEPHECKVEYARLSAHSSASNLETYIRSCTGKRIMVHTPFESNIDGVKIPNYRERIVLPVK